MSSMESGKPLIKPAWRLRPAERRGTLFFGDLLAALIALLAGLYFWAQGDEWLNFSWQFLQERVPVWFYFLPLVWLLLLIESYDVRRSTARLESLKEISLAAGANVALYLLVFFIFNSSNSSLPRRGVIAFIAVAFILTMLWRLIFIC